MPRRTFMGFGDAITMRYGIAEDVDVQCPGHAISLMGEMRRENCGRVLERGKISNAQYSRDGQVRQIFTCPKCGFVGTIKVKS